MSDTPNLTVVPFTGGDLRDIPELLRGIADSIEENKYGEVNDAVLVLRGDTIDIFGLGQADGTVTHYLLHAAMVKMVFPELRAHGVLNDRD